MRSKIENTKESQILFSKPKDDGFSPRSHLHPFPLLQAPGPSRLPHHHHLVRRPKGFSSNLITVLPHTHSHTHSREYTTSSPSPTLFRCFGRPQLQSNEEWGGWDGRPFRSRGSRRAWPETLPATPDPYRSTVTGGDLEAPPALERTGNNELNTGRATMHGWIKCRHVLIMLSICWHCLTSNLFKGQRVKVHGQSFWLPLWPIKEH